MNEPMTHASRRGDIFASTALCGVGPADVATLRMSQDVRAVNCQVCLSLLGTSADPDRGDRP